MARIPKVRKAKWLRKATAAQMQQAHRREIDDAVRRSIARERFSESVNERVAKLMRDMEADITRRLTEFDPEDTSRRVARLKKLKREVGNEIAERYRRIAEEANQDMAELARDEAVWKQGSLQRSWSAVTATAEVALAPTAILNALVDQPVVLGGVAADFWAAEGEALAAKFAQQMQLGIAGGENLGDLIKRVRGSKAQGYKDGIMALSRRNAEALVRTSVNSVANAAHMEVYKQNLDVIEALQHVSVLDNRTTIICSGRHGLAWRADTLAPIGHEHTFQQPPLHWNCRSIVSAMVSTEVDDNQPTFDEWFSSLSNGNQDKLFGPGRAQLFRDGRIGQKDLLSATGRPLTLAELREQSDA